MIVNKTLFSSSGRKGIHSNPVSCQLKRVRFASAVWFYIESGSFSDNKKRPPETSKTHKPVTLVNKYLTYDG